ncbi:MAG TPA: tetratricopeptide repeat protein, partial [Terriglobia bacterium]|nr:tetratricopeptide repeat protein [Terriglobia bacterium]
AAYNNLADLLAKQGNIDAAIDQLQKTVTLKADLAQAHYNLGLLLLQKGEKGKGEEEMQKASALGYHRQTAAQ